MFCGAASGHSETREPQAEHRRRPAHTDAPRSGSSRTLPLKPCLSAFAPLRRDEKQLALFGFRSSFLVVERELNDFREVQRLRALSTAESVPGS